MSQTSSINNDKNTSHGGYAFHAIEQKWQKHWEENAQYVKGEDCRSHTSERKYILEMLPYPSGKLHMGHVRNYAIGDAIARFMSLKGYGVMHPMGWDAFGLPAENAAMQNNVHPKNWTIENVQEMKRQMKMLGLSYNWQREITTCLPDYYKHQQRLFLEIYSKGLLERKESWVNWDPEENSVLANEQVVNGRGWRSGALVEKRLLRQWSCKITKYADELLNDLEKLKGWPEKVVKMQENWIGRSEGAIVNFNITGESKIIPVFTTRPDTLFGASFVAIAPTHPIAADIAKSNIELADFISECQKMITTEEAMSTLDKKGFYTGISVDHPFNQEWKIPVYVANFVLMEYGTGAVFGCPAHDERDFEFATKYNLPIKRVIEGAQVLPFVGEGIVIESEFLNGLPSDEAKKYSIEKLEKEGLGEKKVTYRLRDWLVSRQRYWGCPIPIIYCDDCGVVPVPSDQLPVQLPDDVLFDKPGNPLDHHPSWKHVNCPSCGKPAQRETDTLDTFFDSSWYFLRYICAHNTTQPVVRDEVNQWGPVDWYIGGIEHAVMHLLYARFFTKVLRDLGYLDFDEPFKNLLTQGMVCHETYQDEKGKWLYPSDIVKNEKGQWVTIDTGALVSVGGSIKMSKSKKNLVDPLEILASYGADVARLFMLSDTPPEKDFDWNTEALEGCWRYLNRVSRLIDSIIERIKHLEVETSANNINDSLRFISHQMLQKINDAYDKNAFNKVIAFHREFSRGLEENINNSSAATLREALEFYILTLLPIAPHIAYESYELLCGKVCENIAMPIPDENYVKVQKVTIAVQISGKMRGTFDVAPDQSDDVLSKMAQEVLTVIPHLNGKSIKKIIVIPNRLVNIVAI